MATLRWQPLPAFAKSVPALMVSPAFGPSSYTLHVSDLANVWVEDLDRKGIMKRSLNEDTSIDPSEGADQLRMLLSKIEAAVDPSAPEHDQTSLTLAASTKESLILNITCLLPGDLEPLRWPVHLTKCPPSSVASELVLPLIQAQHARNLEIETLIANLKDKDAVITKLVDKLEATGTGLENVFNSLSGKRNTTRSAAEDKIKGLAPFDKSKWGLGASLDHTTPADVASLVHDVFRTANPVHRTEMNIRASDDLNDWWTTLGSDAVVTVQPQEHMGVSGQPPVSPPHGSRPVADDDSDEFQVQTTPPHLASAEKRKQRLAFDVGDTTDDDDLAVIPDSRPQEQLPRRPRIGPNKLSKKVDEPNSSRSKNFQHNSDTEDETESDSHSRPALPQSRRRLGAIGGKVKRTESPAREASQQLIQTHNDDDTASDTEDDAPEAKSPLSMAQRKKGGLRRVDETAKGAHSPRETKSSSPAPADRAEASPAKPSGRKLGVIGKRRKDEKKVEREALVEPEQIETEEQRTERKRQELAQEMSRKAAAGPTKKKRRF
jgi:hypothetical protein